MDEVKVNLSTKIEAAKKHLQEEFATLRSGRANAAILDQVKVDVYGQEMPINQVATVSVPEARQLIVQPWDKGNIALIEKAISMANLGLSVVNEGDKIRLTVPPMSNERREELVKVAQKMSEDEKVVIRNLRRDSIESLEKQSKDGGMGEDELERHKKDIQSIVDGATKELDTITKSKANELREI
ncbi:MAG: ribosome recycling factor [Patescibacteria group bacterium]|nr:ribosome recycling factor [Patescibacteria group bacterium]